MKKQYRGYTLVEIIIVVAMIVFVVSAVFGLSLQSAQIYSRTSSHIEPQSSLAIAIKRMEWDLREAMLIRNGSSTAVEVVLPLKDTTGGIKFADTPTTSGNNTTYHLTLQQGKHVCFFLGDPAGATSATPDPNGNTIFEVISGNDTTQGTDFMYSDGTFVTSPVSGTSGAIPLISGVENPPLVPDPANPGQYIQSTIFSYAVDSLNPPSGLNPGTVSGATDTTNGNLAQLITINLTVPITQPGQPTENHSLSTQLCLRNIDVVRW